MASRVMVVVGAGSSSRFGGDKLMTPVAGIPLIAHTVRAVTDSVDLCVLVCRPDQVDPLRRLELDATITVGGRSRTESEMAGLAAAGGEHDLIGVHDGARPLVGREMIEKLFSTAESVGGAVPVMEPETLLVDRRHLRPIEDAVTVQTPQVFRASGLLAAFVRAAQDDFRGQDTVDVVQTFGELDVAAIPGDPKNLKVTYAEDLEEVRSLLEGSSHSEPR